MKANNRNAFCNSLIEARLENNYNSFNSVLNNKDFIANYKYYDLNQYKKYSNAQLKKIEPSDFLTNSLRYGNKSTSQALVKKGYKIEQSKIISLLNLIAQHSCVEKNKDFVPSLNYILKQSIADQSQHTQFITHSDIEYKLFSDHDNKNSLAKLKKLSVMKDSLLPYIQDDAKEFFNTRLTECKDALEKLNEFI